MIFREDRGIEVEGQKFEKVEEYIYLGRKIILRFKINEWKSKEERYLTYVCTIRIMLRRETWMMQKTNINSLRTI